MPTYPFPHAIALDEPSGGIARNAEGQVYDVSDTAFATPLAITDLAGVPLTSLTASNQGIIPAFRATAAEPRVMWKSGGYTIEILSNDAIIEATTSAQADAAQAVIDVNAAIAASVLPTGAQVADVPIWDGTKWSPGPQTATGGTGTGDVTTDQLAAAIAHFPAVSRWDATARAFEAVDPAAPAAFYVATNDATFDAATESPTGTSAHDLLFTIDTGA